MVILLGIGAIQAQAATYTVNALGDAGDFTCDATCTLRDAIQAANANPDNDTIEFSVTGMIILTSGDLLIANNGTLTINGPGADQLTISGNNASRVFGVTSSATVVINGVTISGGNSGSGSNGGGVFNVGSLTVTNSTISGNTGYWGGGIFSLGTLNVTNSTISGNTAAGGGGGIGGGIANNDGTLTVTNSTISGNTAAGGGGAAGAIWNVGSPGRLATANITNSTFSGNSAPFVGGILSSQYGSVTLKNSIVANSPSGGDCFNSSGTINAEFSLIEDGSCGVTSGINGNRTGDPNLGPLQNNGGPTQTHALLAGSPAINAGSDLLIPVGITTDQRGTGFARIFGAAVDMGAFEVQSPPDADGDGVFDADDVCPGTVLPEDRPAGLRKNRFYANELGNFIDAGGTSAGITVIDTGGCSGIQIIEVVGLGSGHVRFGITRSALEAWIAALP